MRSVTLSDGTVSFTEIPSPTVLGTHEVLVKVHAVGITPFDLDLTYDLSGFLDAGQARYGIGSTFVGEVSQTGTGVSSFGAGDLVFGMVPNPLKQGTLSQFLVVPASVCTRRPSNLSVSEAASLVCDALTAERTLRLVKARDTDSILITGGATPLAKVLIEIAKSSMFGVEWIATSVDSLDDRQYSESIGADETFDTTTNGGAWSKVFESGINQKTYDVVIDLVGDSKRAKRLLNRQSGRFVSLFNKITPMELLDFSKRIPDNGFVKTRFLSSIFLGPVVAGCSGRMAFAKGRYFAVLPSGDGEILERLAVLMETEAVSPNVHETVPFEPTAISAVIGRLKSAPFGHRGRFVVVL